jgi:hypothetical protein
LALDKEEETRINEIGHFGEEELGDEQRVEGEQ